MANLGHRGGVGRGHREVGFHGSRPLDKEADRLELKHLLERRQLLWIRQQKRQKRVLLLARAVQRRAARHEHFRSWSRGEETRDQRRRLEDALEIIEDQQQPFCADHRGQAPRQLTPFLAHPKHGGNGRGDQIRIVERTQIDEPDPIWKVLQHVGGGLDGHTGLADSARTSDRQEPDIITAKEVDDLSDLIFPAEKRRRFYGEVVRLSSERSQWREVGSQVRMNQLEDVLRSVEIAQRVLSQVAQTRTHWQGTVRQVVRHQGEEYLSAMGSGYQTGEAIEPGSQVVPVTRLSGRGMQCHADGERATHLGPAIRCQ
jgi:hypothetical protein